MNILISLSLIFIAIAMFCLILRMFNEMLEVFPDKADDILEIIGLGSLLIAATLWLVLIVAFLIWVLGL